MPLPSTMRAAVLRAPGEVEVVEMPTPRPGPGEAVVRVRACGICGSDLMDWYVASRAPFVLGHELAGEIAELGPGVEGFQPGDPVFVHHHAPCGTCAACRRGDAVHCPQWRRSRLDPGGMAEYVRVPAEHLQRDTLRLPPGLSFEDGALVEPVACAVKALRRAAAVLLGLTPPASGQARDAGRDGAARSKPLAGARVAVLGLGFAGQVLGTLARAQGASLLWGADPVEPRRRRALRWADRVLDPQQEAAELQGTGADLAVVAAPSPPAVALAVQSVRPGGVVLLYAPLPPGVGLPVPAHDLFFREVTLVPSYSAGPADTRAALEWITRGAVRAADWVTHRFPLEQAVEAYRAARQGGDVLKVMVKMGANEE